MSAVVDLGQMLKIKMGVDLGGGYVAVTKQLLYGPKVTTGFQKMAGKGMAKHMRVHVPPQPVALRQQLNP